MTQQWRNKPMSEYCIRNPQGFSDGYTSITRIGETPHDTGIEFGILKLKSGKEKHIHYPLESAWLLMKGQCLFKHDEVEKKVERSCYFNEDPSALHVAANNRASIIALTDCEFAVSQVMNHKNFPTQIYDTHNMLES